MIQRKQKHHQQQQQQQERRMISTKIVLFVFVIVVVVVLPTFVDSFPLTVLPSSSSTLLSNNKHLQQQQQQTRHVSTTTTQQRQPKRFGTTTTTTSLKVGLFWNEPKKERKSTTAATTTKTVLPSWLLDPKSETNPTIKQQQQQQPLSVANVFGKPISQSMKDMNYQVVHTIKGFLFDTIYSGPTLHRAYCRFYALETIARMPYFSYVCVLHMYETLGFWRESNLLKTHFSEGWNELHHLLIMEELLENNISWYDQFIAQHIAFFYYWIVIGLYIYNPIVAYNLNENVEEEAYETYNHFLQTHGDVLKTLPPPSIAIKYYTGDDLYLFDTMHTTTSTNKQQKQEPSLSPIAVTTSSEPNFLQKLFNNNKKPKQPQPLPIVQQQHQYEQEHGEHEEELQQQQQSKKRRRPKIETLYDVFVAIRDDEMEHVKTMEQCQT